METWAFPILILIGAFLVAAWGWRASQSDASSDQLNRGLREKLKSLDGKGPFSKRD